MRRKGSLALHTRLQGLLVAAGALAAGLYPFVAPEAMAPRIHAWGTVGAASVLGVLALVLAVVYPLRPSPGFWYGLMSLQVVSAAAVVLFSGGADSPALFLLVLVVAASGLQHSPWIGVAAGSLAAVLWVLVFMLGRGTDQGLAGVLVRALSLLAFGTFGFLATATRSGAQEQVAGRQALRLEEAYATARQQAQERERREHELFDKQRKLAALMQLSRQLSTVRHPDELLSMIVRSAKDEMNSAIAVVMLSQGTELRIAQSHGLSQFSVEGYRERVGAGLFGRVVISGEHLRLSEADGDAWRDSIPGLRERLRTLLAVPLQSPQDKLPTGVLWVANLLVGDSYQQDHDDYLKLLANDAAIWIKNISLLAELERSYYEIIQALAQAIEAKDPYTHGHVARVRTYATRLARALQLPADEVELISKAAILHDVGKISIPDGILMKPGALSDEEFDVMKSHAENSLHILKDIRSLSPRIVDMVLHHHERYDGRGYPHGLKGEEIPLGAQIIGVADTFDAMTSDRPYRKGFSAEEALARMEAAMGTQFNPRLLKAFFGLFEFRPKKSLALEVETGKEVG